MAIRSTSSKFPIARSSARSPSPSSVDDELRTLVADMFDTMYEAPGIGLAAVQVAVPIRLLVIDLQDPAIRRTRKARRSRIRMSSSIPRCCAFGP